MILSKNEKMTLNKEFEEQGSTIETVEEWLKYESRLLEDEMDSVYSDFLKKRKILNEIGKEEIQEELNKL